MLTKKENLLIRPWIVQRYRAHREKVKSAGPRIDFRSPPNRVHVRVKEKKRQKESERKNEIELENIRLLQRLTVIMNTLRLDNFWRTPRPNFLNRQPIYKSKSAPDSKKSSTSRGNTPVDSLPQNLQGSAKRCSACNNKSNDQLRTKFNKIAPEKRIPWATPKNNWNRTLDFEPKTHNCCRFCC